MKKTALRNSALNVLAFLIVLFSLCSSLTAQTDTSVTLTYDFNDHQIREKDGKTTVRFRGATLTSDRFGNHESALLLNGKRGSYFSLGVSPLLKSTNVSISLWVKIIDKVQDFTGYGGIPIVQSNNRPGFDFINAITIAYDFHTNRFGINSTRDSLLEVSVMGADSIIYNKWYHFVLVCNNSYFAFFIDGQLIGKTEKNFETRYLQTDSMVIGNSCSTKNRAMLHGVVDDVKIFHRPLNATEVEELYNAPNPNKNQRYLSLFYKFAVVVLGLILIIIVLIVRNRRALKKQRDELDLENRISGLELKAVKAQMNPHFISNCLAAIQDLNYNQETEKAGLYLANFSLFLRQVLDYSDENYVSISQEAEVIRLFAELEKLRFKNGFSFTIYVDDAISQKELAIPALITQPFVENAIWHGLLPLKGLREPELTIRFLLMDGYPHIEIEDNGVGRDLNKKVSGKRKGTQLTTDKMEMLNRLTKSERHKIDIVDLKDNKGSNKGTKIIISLDLVKE